MTDTTLYAAMAKEDPQRLTLLQMTLSVAVPMWIERLKSKPWSHIVVRSQACAQVVAEKGDVIQFKSAKKGETANAVNHLAEGVACLAFVPGGVTIFGQHFEAKHAGPPAAVPVTIGDSIVQTLTNPKRGRRAKLDT